jgi:hypothetical protein
VSQARENLRSRCRRQEAVAQFGKLLYRRLAVGPLPEWPHRIHIHSWHSRHSTHSAFCIAWPVCRNQWHWRMAKEDATEKAAEGHVWSRLVIFGHLWSCSASESFSDLFVLVLVLVLDSPHLPGHDIFQNFKNLSSFVAFCRLLSGSRHTTFLKIFKNGCVWLSSVAFGRVGPFAKVSRLSTPWIQNPQIQQSINPVLEPPYRLWCFKLYIRARLSWMSILDRASEPFVIAPLALLAPSKYTG